jgi:hypothetical protein
MTLLLFLASLAVVHYIVSRQPAVDGPGPELKPPAHAPERTTTELPGLLALEDALERHGRGQAPQIVKPQSELLKPQ